MKIALENLNLSRLALEDLVRRLASALPLLFLALLAAHPSLAQSSGSGFPSLLLVDGKITTEDPAHPEVQAVAIAGNQIVAAGGNAEIMKLAGSGTRIIHLHGRRVLPGFNDAHVHVMVGGEDELGVHLTTSKSAQDFRDRLAAYAKSIPRGQWILNGLWDEQRWPSRALPTHQLIDDVTPDNPVAVSRTDLHMLLANRKAMELAHVDRNTKDVPGGVIMRDKDGNPTGIFKDAAKALILDAVPPPTLNDVERDFLAMQSVAEHNGVTSVQDMAISADDPGGPLRLRAIEDLHRQGKLQVRVAEALSLNYGRELADLGIQADFGNPYYHIGSLKSFADGGLGASTAWFTQPYTDNPSNYGIASDQLRNPEKMFADFQLADKAGLQLITHAIGDRANHTILDFYERLEKEDGPRNRRFRIEHAQTLLPSDIPRFAQLHVIASVQPYHAIDDGRWAESRIGPQRIKTTYAFRSLIDSGAIVCFGSDWPVAPLAPLIGIYAAVTRRTIDGKNPNGWIPEQKIAVAQAVKAYTVNAAYAEGEDNIKGAIKPGQLADIVVLADDIFSIDPVQIESAQVDFTIIDGKIVYQRRNDPK
jgi:predicted amidohydrolase YtcJ